MEEGKIKVLGEGARKMSTAEELNGLFNTFDVSGIDDKIAILKHAMYAEEVFYTPGMDKEQIFELEMDVFLTGDWR